MSGLIADPASPGASIVPYRNFTPPPETPDKLAVSVTPGSKDQYAIGSHEQIASVPDQSQADIDAKYESWKKAGQPGSWLDWSGQSKDAAPQSGQPTDLTKPDVAKPENAHAQALDYVTRTRQLEGSGKDPRSSAVGGFIDSTWLDTIHKIRPETLNMPPEQVLAMRYDESPAGIALRDQATAQYASENSAVLQKAGFPVNPTNLRLAHFLGPGGAVQVLSVPPGTLMSEINPKAVAANPTLQGRTAGEVIQLANDQMNGNTAANMRRTALGPFNEGASAFLQTWQQDIQKRSKEYDDALAEGKDLRKAARAAMAKWELSSEHPPQDMRENWNQWAGAAIGLAMLGGFFGKNHTAAINAAGEMLQAANQADVRAYDIAYKKWKDHNDNGLKLIELLHGEARDIVEDARKSYDQKVTELATLSTVYQLQQHLDPTSVENIEKNLRIQKERTDLINTQNVDANVRLTTEQYDKDWAEKNPEEAKKWVADHPGQSPVPPNIHAENFNKATRLMTGAAGATKDAIAQQIYTSTVSAEIQSWLAKPENAGKTTADIPPDEMARIQSRAGTAAGLIPSSASRAGTDPKLQAAEAFKEKIRKEKGTEPTYEDWVKFSQDTGRSQTGQLSPDAVKLLARQYEMGDPAAITSMPRGGPARIQVENQIAEDMKGIDDASRQIVMNRLRMAEAQSAARSAGRITMNTELYVKAAEGAGKLVVDASKAFPRTNFPKINDALAAYERNVGDPNIIKFGASINALLNEYGKMSNPTGTGIHDADKDRLARILDTGLSQGQIEGAVQMIVAEGRNISDAAMKAQLDVLSSLAPAPPGQQASPTSSPTPSPAALPTDLPPATGLKEGAQAKDESGKVVAVIRNGQWAAP